MKYSRPLSCIGITIRAMGDVVIKTHEVVRGSEDPRNKVKVSKTIGTTDREDRLSRGPCLYRPASSP